MALFDSGVVLQRYFLITIRAYLLGVVQRAWLSDREGRAQIRRAKNPKVQEIRDDVENKISEGISVGYMIIQAKKDDY